MPGRAITPFRSLRARRELESDVSSGLATDAELEAASSAAGADARLPTSSQKSALTGTGERAVGAGNPYLTKYDLLNRVDLTQSSGTAPHELTATGTGGLKVDDWGSVFFGENRLAPAFGSDPAGWNRHQAAPDGLYDASTLRWFMRSLILTEVGDPVDLSIGRFGPNDGYPNGPNDTAAGLTGVLANESLGNIYFWGAATRLGDTPGVDDNVSLQSRSAQITAKAAENIREIAPGNTYAAGGHLIFSVTKIGGNTVTERVRLYSEGYLLVGLDTPMTSPVVVGATEGAIHASSEIRGSKLITAYAGVTGEVTIGAAGPAGEAAVVFNPGSSGAPGTRRIYLKSGGSVIKTSHTLEVPDLTSLGLITTPSLTATGTVTAGTLASTGGVTATSDVVARSGGASAQVSIGGVGPGSNAGIKFTGSGPTLGISNSTGVACSGGLAAFGHAAPGAQPALIASPAADVNQLKTAVDGIRTILIGAGFMAAV